MNAYRDYHFGEPLAQPRSMPIFAITSPTDPNLRHARFLASEEDAERWAMTVYPEERRPLVLWSWRAGARTPILTVRAEHEVVPGWI